MEPEEPVDVEAVLGKREREDGLGGLVNDVLQAEVDRKQKKSRVTIDETQNVVHAIPAPPPLDPLAEDDEEARCSTQRAS